MPQRVRVFMSVLVLMLAHQRAEAGEPIQCECFFDQKSGYSAVGTRAVCSAVTEKNGKGEACVITFGAALSRPSETEKLTLGKDYRTEALALTLKNLTAIQNNEPLLIADATYLRQAIPAYFRASYTRDELGMPKDVLADVDKEVVGFAAEYSSRIAGVFRRDQPPFEATWHDRHTVRVQVGALSFVYAQRYFLTAVFFNPADLR